MCFILFLTTCCWRWDPAKHNQKAGSLLSAASLCGTEVLPLSATTLRLLGPCFSFCSRLCVRVYMLTCEEKMEKTWDCCFPTSSTQLLKWGYHSREKFCPGKRGKRQGINQSTWDLRLYFKQRIEKSTCKTLSETAEVVMKSNWEVIVRFMGKYRQNSRLASLLLWNRRNELGEEAAFLHSQNVFLTHWLQVLWPCHTFLFSFFF